MKLVSLGLAGLAAAEYTSCSRPLGEWVGIDQGNGRSSFYAVVMAGSNVFTAGHAYGNFSFSSMHRTNGATGETTDHTNVVIQHETGSVATSGAGGRYSDPASSQHGMDAVIMKMSDTGVPSGMFAMDVLPYDGLMANSANGRWGGYSYFYGMDNFEQSGDTTSIVGCGSFRGSMTSPMVGGGQH